MTKTLRTYQNPPVSNTSESHMRPRRARNPPGAIADTPIVSAAAGTTKVNFVPKESPVASAACPSPVVERRTDHPMGSAGQNPPTVPLPQPTDRVRQHPCRPHRVGLQRGQGYT